MNDTSHIRDKFFYPLDEVRMKIGLYTTDGIVVHDQTSAASLFKNIENLFTVTESVEESSQCSKVHGEGGVEQ